MRRPRLDLSFSEPSNRRYTIAPLKVGGFAIDHVRLTSSDGYDFFSRGAEHYLAFHDLMLEDGELAVEGTPHVRGRDLRGTLTYVPAGRGISGWAKPAARANSFTTLQINTAAICPELADRFRAGEPEPLIYGRDPALVATMRKLSRVALSPQPDALYAETLCLAAALEIFGATAAPLRPGRLSPAQMRRVQEYVDADIAGDLSLGALARVANLSRSHFSRAFSASFGVGPHQFVQDRRVARATALLVGSRLHPDEIAAQVGFASPAAFRRSFLRATGQTPAALRRQG